MRVWFYPGRAPVRYPPVGVKSGGHGNQQPGEAAPLEKLDCPQEAEGEKYKYTY